MIDKGFKKGVTLGNISLAKYPMLSKEQSRKEKLERDIYGDITTSEELKKIWEDVSGVFPDIQIAHPLIMELVEALGYETIYDALVAIVKEKGLWKDEWDRGEEKEDERREE